MRQKGRVKPINADWKKEMQIKKLTSIKALTLKYFRVVFAAGQIPISNFSSTLTFYFCLSVVSRFGNRFGTHHARIHEVIDDL